jgi:hypothetical protein
MGLWSIIKDHISTPKDEDKGIKYYCSISDCFLRHKGVIGSKHVSWNVCQECGVMLQVKCRKCKRYVHQLDMNRHSHYKTHGISCYKRKWY